MKLSTVRVGAAAAAASGFLLVSLAVAAPAQAHNGNYNCTTWWNGEGMTLNCTGAQAGDTAQGRVGCQSIGGGSVIYRYSVTITNGQTNRFCLSGEDAVSKQYRENYADGHTTGWIS